MNITRLLAVSLCLSAISASAQKADSGKAIKKVTAKEALSDVTLSKADMNSLLQSGKVSFAIVDATKKNTGEQTVEIDWPFNNKTSDKKAEETFMNEITAALKASDVKCLPPLKKIATGVWLCADGKTKVKSNNLQLTKLLDRKWEQ